MVPLCTYDTCTQYVLMHVGFQYKVENINTSNAAVNILVAVSLQTSLFVFLLTKFLEVELLSQMQWTFYGFRYILPTCQDCFYLSLSPCAWLRHCLIDFCFIDEWMNKRKPSFSSLNEPGPFKSKISFCLLCLELSLVFFIPLTLSLEDTQLRAFPHRTT